MFWLIILKHITCSWVLNQQWFCLSYILKTPILKDFLNKLQIITQINSLALSAQTKSSFLHYLFKARQKSVHKTKLIPFDFFWKPESSSLGAFLFTPDLSVICLLFMSSSFWIYINKNACLKFCCKVNLSLETYILST